jgi:hypothetical protein
LPVLGAVKIVPPVGLNLDRSIWLPERQFVLRQELIVADSSIWALARGSQSANWSKRYLTGHGYDVTVVEREELPDGCAGALHRDGFTFRADNYRAIQSRATETVSSLK